MGRRSSSSEIEKSQSDFATLRPALDRISIAISDWQKDLSKIPPSETPERIVETCVDDFNLFAESRESLISEKSLPEYAAIMTEFAAAERTINRLVSGCRRIR